jgi:MFS transporter, ACS family, tartrate transporter
MALKMSDRLGLSPSVFGLGASVFFATYALCEVPSNIAFAHWGARVWLARIMIKWGLITVGTIFISAAPPFVAVRLLLGVAQARFLPATVICIARWYPAQCRARAMATFLSAPALA